MKTFININFIDNKINLTIIFFVQGKQNVNKLTVEYNQEINI